MSTASRRPSPKLPTVGGRVLPRPMSQGRTPLVLSQSRSATELSGAKDIGEPQNVSSVGFSLSGLFVVVSVSTAIFHVFVCPLTSSGQLQNTAPGLTQTFAHRHGAHRLSKPRPRNRIFPVTRHDVERGLSWGQPVVLLNVFSIATPPTTPRPTTLRHATAVPPAPRPNMTLLLTTLLVKMGRFWKTHIHSSFNNLFSHTCSRKSGNLPFLSSHRAAT